MPKFGGAGIGTELCRLVGLQTEQPLITVGLEGGRKLTDLKIVPGQSEIKDNC